MSTYNLRAEVRAALAETSLTDPGEIADKIAESVPARQLRSALRVTLRAFVRQVMSETRRHGIGQCGTEAQVGRAGAVPASTKVAAIRSAWEQQLSCRVHVGGSNWKMFGDCQTVDLQMMAAEREELARRNEAWATRYRRLADLLGHHRADRVRDLPDAVLAAELGEAAAA